MIKRDSSDKDIQEVLEKNDKMADILSVVQHHDAITGTHAAHVSVQYSTDLARAFTDGSNLYKSQLKAQIEDKYGIKLGDVSMCVGS